MSIEKKYYLIKNTTNFDYIDWYFSKSSITIHINNVSLKWKCNYYMPFTYYNKNVIVYTDKCKDILKLYE